MNKQRTLSCRNVLLLHKRHQSSHNRGSVACQQIIRMFSSKNPDDSLKACVHSSYIPPFLCISITFVTSLNDVTIVCFPLLVGKTLCMCRRAMQAHLHICWHPCWLISAVPTAMHGPACQFHIPNFEPVTHTHTHTHTHIYLYMDIVLSYIHMNDMLKFALCASSAASGQMYTDWGAQCHALLDSPDDVA